MRSMVYGALPIVLLVQAVLAGTEANSNRLSRRDPVPATKDRNSLLARRDAPKLFKRSTVHKRSKKVGEGKVGVYKRGHIPKDGHKRWVWGTSIIQDPTGTETTQPISTRTTPGVTLVNPFESKTTTLTPSSSSSSTTSPAAVFSSTSSHVAVVPTSTSPSAPSASPSSTQVAMAYPFVSTQNFDETLAPGMCPGVFQGVNTVFICSCLQSEASAVFVGCTPSTNQEVAAFCAGTAPRCLSKLCPTGKCDSLAMTGSAVPANSCSANTAAGWKIGKGCGCYSTGTARVTSCDASNVCVSQQIQGNVGSGATMSQCLAASNSDISTSSAVSSVIPLSSTGVSSSTTPLPVSSVTSSGVNTISSSLTTAPPASPTPPDSTHTWTLLPYGTTSIWVEVYSTSTTYSSSRRSTSPPPPPPTSTSTLSSSTSISTSSPLAPPASPTPPDSTHTWTLVPYGTTSIWVEVYSYSTTYSSSRRSTSPPPPPPTSTSSPTTSTSSAPASAPTCSQTAECTAPIPANAHQRCFDGKCTFKCNKHYVLDSFGTSCILAVTPSLSPSSTTLSSSPSSSPSSAPTTCTQTTDCPLAVPLHAHRICWRKKAQCGFKCDKKYELNAQGDGCILSSASTTSSDGGDSIGEAALLVARD